MKNMIYYLWVLLQAVAAFLKKHFLKVCSLAASTWLLYRYKIDSEQFETALKWYSDLDDMALLQLWMIGTVILGFVVNHVSTIKTERAKKLLEVKLRQVETVTLLAQKMTQCATETSVFCRKIIKFKQRLDYNNPSQEEKDYFGNIFMKDYSKYLQSQQNYINIYNEFMAISNVHSGTYARYNQRKNISLISSLFNEIIMGSLMFELYIDINNVDDFIFHMGFFQYSNLIELEAVAKKKGMKIGVIASNISSSLTQEIQTPTFKIIKAIFKNPRYIIHNKLYLEDKVELEPHLINRFLKDLED